MEMPSWKRKRPSQGGTKAGLVAGNNENDITARRQRILLEASDSEDENNSVNTAELIRRIRPSNRLNETQQVQAKTDGSKAETASILRMSTTNIDARRDHGAPPLETKSNEHPQSCNSKPTTGIDASSCSSEDEGSVTTAELQRRLRVNFQHHAKDPSYRTIGEIKVDKQLKFELPSRFDASSSSSSDQSGDESVSVLD